MEMYVNIEFKGNPVGGTLRFTDMAELMEFIEGQMEFGRTVTIGSKDIFREEAITPW